jgi:hypothetical protein
MGAKWVRFDNFFMLGMTFSATAWHSATQFGEGAVNLAIEHILVANDAEDAGGGGEGGEKRATGAGLFVVLFGEAKLGAAVGQIAFGLGDGLGKLFAQVGDMGRGGDAIHVVDDLEEGVGQQDFGLLGGGKLVGGLGDKLGGPVEVGQVLLGLIDGGPGLFRFVGVGVGGVEGGTDGAALEALGAAKAPVGGGDALDEGFFD